MWLREQTLRRGIEERKAIWGWSFVIPAVIFFALFSFYPIFNALYMSFFRKDLLSLAAPKFIGFKNYIYLFNSPDFWSSLKATAVFTAGAFSLLVVVSLALAVFITSRKRFQKVMQMAYFSPAVVSSVVAASIWLLMFDPRGLANQWMHMITGQSGIDYRWLASASMLQLSTVLVYFWKYVGYFTIIFIAGLASIPRTLYEAARIDGASSWQRFWRVTFPLLKPTTLLVSVVSMIQCLRTFSIQYMFTQAGAPKGPIDVIALSVYNTAIRDHRIGRASALSIILFCIMLFLSWVQLKISRSEDVTY